MSKSVMRLLLILLALCATFATVAAQRRQTKSSRATDPSVELYLSASRKLAQEALTLEPLAKRVDLLVRLSDAVWDWDELLARNLLAKSFNLIADGAKAGERTEADLTKHDIELLFERLIDVAASHDPGLAREFIKKGDSVIERAPQLGAEKTAGPRQISLLLLSEVTIKIKNDKQRAQALFSQSVLNYVTQEHFWFLKALRRESPELANSLFADAVAILSKRELREANEILILASYLFSPTETVAYDLVSGYNTANPFGNLSATPSRPALARTYLTVLFQQLHPTEVVPPAVVYLALKNLLPQFNALTPELMDAVYGRLANLRAAIVSKELDEYEKRNPGEFADSSDNWNHRLQKAEEIANPELRDLAYFNLIDGQLLRRKDFSGAYSLIDRITDQAAREKLRDYVHLLVVQESSAKANADSFRYDLINDKINDPLLKTLVLYEGARFSLKQNKMGEAMQLLNTASKHAEKISGNQERLQAKLIAIKLYLNLDQSRAFEMAREVFEKIGKTVDFDIWSESFSLPIKLYGLTNELPISPDGGSSLVSTLARLSKTDSIETLDILNIIENRETRSWATLMAIKYFLSTAKELAEKEK